MIWFRPLGNGKVYLRPGVTGLRKSINTLAMIVEGKMKKDPYEESIFLF
ncbi:transposase [Leptospira weilii]|nr:transposase [Leptospira weilii]